MSERPKLQSLVNNLSKYTDADLEKLEAQLKDTLPTAPKFSVELGRYFDNDFSVQGRDIYKLTYDHQLLVNFRGTLTLKPVPYVTKPGEHSTGEKVMALSKSIGADLGQLDGELIVRRQENLLSVESGTRFFYPLTGTRWSHLGNGGSECPCIVWDYQTKRYVIKLKPLQADWEWSDNGRLLVPEGTRAPAPIGR